MQTLLSTAFEQVPVARQGADSLPCGAKAGPWIVERELGRGGMGAVYAVVHEEIGKRAALKVVHRHLLGTGFNPDRMLVEARVVNQVGHPNIVDIFETGHLSDGRPYIVMERLEGQSLAHRVDAGPLPPERSIAILCQLCEGLIAAHAAGVVHRDLKLDNVFLVDNFEDPDAPRVKILDWGIAKIVHGDVNHTMEGQLVGTPQYLSPEQARGGKVTSKTDVYSLGVMAFELFLDQLPFQAETSAEIMAMHLRAPPPPPRDLWPEIPPALDQLLLAMMAKRPEQRPTMLEVATQLEQVLAELCGARCSSEIAAQARPPSISRPIPVPTTPTPDAQAERSSSRPALRPPLARRWRYAAGGIALAGGLALLLSLRGGDRVAAAAAVPAAQAVAPPAPSAASAGTWAILVPPAVAVPAAAAASAPPAAGGDAAPRAAATAADHAPPPPAQAGRAPGRAPHRARAAHATSPPPAQRRLDPDGTIDPYR